MLRLVLILTLLTLLPGLSQAQIGYVITRSGDSLAGPIIYQYQHATLHLVSDGQIYAISTGATKRFAIYDGECQRYRHYEPIAALDSVAPDGIHHPSAKPVICEVADLLGGGRLLMRIPYRFVEKNSPSLADAMLGEQAKVVTQTEHRLRRIARHTTRKYADAEPVYYFQQGDKIQCLSPTRQFIHVKWRVQDTKTFLTSMGERGQRVSDWVHIKGNPLHRRKRMDDFVLAFCQIEHKDYARP